MAIRSFNGKPHRPLLIAHRGSSSTAPENTLPAFEQALRDGADAVECDIRLTADSIPVLCHDETLLRISGLSERVDSMTCEHLQRLDVGFWKGEAWANVRMPTLREALGWSINGLPLVIELKASPHPERLVREVANLVRTFPGRVRIVSSFSGEILDELRRQASSLPRALIASSGLGSALELAKHHGAVELHFRADAFVEEGGALTDTRLPVFFWTVDDPLLGNSLLNDGAAGLVSNIPARLTKLVHDKAA